MKFAPELCLGSAVSSTTSILPSALSSGSDTSARPRPIAVMCAAFASHKTPKPREPSAVTPVYATVTSPPEIPAGGSIRVMRMGSLIDSLKTLHVIEHVAGCLTLNVARAAPLVDHAQVRVPLRVIIPPVPADEKSSRQYARSQAEPIKAN